MYDYLVVGSGLFGAVFAHEAKKAGRTVLLVERRAQSGGNIYCENIDGIHVHKFGAHIFHTSDKTVWEYVNRFAQFNRYTNAPIANYKGEIYNLPFNMNTFNKMWGVITPQQAKDKIEEQCQSICGEPTNLEEQAIKLVGRDIYNKLIKCYTEKQWGRKCTDLPPSIIKRLPVRFTYDNNYFDDLYQGIPIGGYNVIVDKLLAGIPVKLDVDFLKNRDELTRQAKKVLFTGAIDEYFDYCLGPLQYRSVYFETSRLEVENYQGNAVVNYTDEASPYTRIIEHKHFEFGTQKTTVISKEYSAEWKPGAEPYYPVNDERNNALYAKYAARAQQEPNVLFGGRLGEYKYYNMDKVIASALQLAAKEF